MSTSEQRSDSKVYAKYERGIAYAFIDNHLFRFENQGLARELLDKGNKPDFTRMQDTYSFEFNGRVELVYESTPIPEDEDELNHAQHDARNELPQRRPRVARLVPTPQQQPDSFGFEHGILSEQEGWMEQCIDSIRSAETTLHAFGPLKDLLDRLKGQPDELSKAQARIRELDRMLEQFVYYGTIHTVRGVVPADFNSHEGLITLAKNYLQNK